MKNPQKKLSNLRIKQQALYILIFSFVTVIVWIIGSLFRSQQRTGISPDLIELAKPLSPTINVSVIDSIEARKVYSDQDLFNFQIYKIIKSKDGMTQQVVPINSDADQIPADEIKVFIQEDNLLDSEESLTTKTNLEEQINSGLGVVSPEIDQVESAFNPNDSIILPARSPGFGADGRYYLD